jgi:tetratricopeptide (TPR) repeat protein
MEADSLFEQRLHLNRSHAALFPRARGLFNADPVLPAGTLLNGQNQLRSPRRSFFARKIEMKMPAANLLLAAYAILLCLGVPANAIVIVVGNTDARDCFLIARAGNNPSGGIAACDSALKTELLTPHDHAGTFVNRAAMKIALHQIDDAITDYTEAVSIQPNLADAYVDRAIAFIMQKRFDEAMTDVNRSIELGLTHPYMGYYNRAVVEQLSGKFKDAYLDYQKALQMEPDFMLAAERLKDFVATRPGPIASPAN